MNLANRITLIRIFLIPIITILLLIIPFKNSLLYNDLWYKWLIIKSNNITYSISINNLIAGILFIIASLTDLLDGFIARHYKQMTIFGKFFDSIADKLLINIVLIIFVYIKNIPIWITILLITRDFIINFIRQILATQNIIMASNQLGRLRTLLEMFGIIILFFINFNFFNGYPLKTGLWNEFGLINQIIMIPMYLSIVLSILSAINYIFLNRKILFNLIFAKKIKLKNNKKIKNNNSKWAIVTGASKGLGFCYCKELLKLGYNIIAVSRNTNSVLNLQKKYQKQIIKIFNYDLSNIENCKKLFNDVLNINITILINNAGYGVWGYFNETNLDKEINMINLNIQATHILTKLFVKRFITQNKGGRILNISSLAAFTPAPIFSSYYASKTYILNLGIAINTELKKIKSSVRVITLCPGPLKTDFWNRSSDQKCAKYYSKIKVMKTSVYAKKSLLKGLKIKRKNYIIIKIINKIIKKIIKWCPQSLILTIIYNYQKKRK